MFSAYLSAQELNGLVYDDQNTPLVGAIIHIHETNQTAVSSGDGSFFFDDIPEEGHLHLHVQAVGFQAAVLDVELPSKTLIVVQLIPTLIELSEAVVEDQLLRLEIRKTPQEVIRIDSKQLSKNGGGAFATALDRLPGVQSIQVGVGIAKPVIRGFSGARIQVLNDGVKQEGQQWGQDHGLEIDAFSVNEIEIIKGAAALQYGPDATGGVLKILPGAIPSEGIHGSVSSVGRTNNVSAAVSGLLTYRQSNWFIGLRETYDRAGDYRIPANEFVYNTYVLPILNGRLKNTAYSQWNTSFFGGYLGKYRSLRLSYTRFDQFSGLFPGAVAIPGYNDLRNPGDRYDIEIPSQSVVHDKLALQWLEHFGELIWQNELGYQVNNRLETSSPAGHGIHYVDPKDSAALGLLLNTFSWNSSLSGHAGKYKWTAGIQTEYQNNKRSGWDFLLPDYERLQWGAFGVVNYQINHHWNVQAGLRYDLGTHVSQQYAQPYFSQPDSLVMRVSDLNRFLNGVSGSIGFAYLPNQVFTIKGQFAQSYRMPQAAEWVSNGVHHGTFRHEMGDENLNPEIGWQSDLGLIVQREAYLLRFSPYLNYFENYIYLRPSGVFSPLPDAGQIYRYSQARVLHSGVEVYGEWHPIKLLHLELSGEYVYAQNINTNLSLPFTPPGRIFSSVEYEGFVWKSNFSIGVEGEYSFAQNRTDRNEAATPAYSLIHLHLTIDHPFGFQNFAVNLRIQNLLDEVYLRHLSRYRLLGMPEQGRNLIVRLNYSF